MAINQEIDLGEIALLLPDDLSAGSDIMGIVVRTKENAIDRHKIGINPAAEFRLGRFSLVKQMNDLLSIHIEQRQNGLRGYSVVLALPAPRFGVGPLKRRDHRPRNERAKCLNFQTTNW